MDRIVLDKKIRSLVFFPFKNKIQNALYLNYMQCDAIEEYLDSPFYLQQNFKPYSEELSHPSTPDLPPEEQNFSTVIIQGTKNTVETKYLLAKGVAVLEAGGILSIAADNKSGGNRLEKLLKDIGFEDVDSYSKHKARVAWGKALRINHSIWKQWVEEGETQDILDGSYQSKPGIFGWNKIDKGSAFLIQNLPPPGPQGQSKILKGKGSDFGCGYGYLTKEILQSYSGIKHMTCLDADYRAVEACRVNTKNFDTAIECQWADLAKQTPLKNLDFIVMNPPFHEGKNTDQSIGKAFIINAAAALKKHGELWMVANNHLGYEAVLDAHFFKTEKISEGQGFKIFRAVK